MKSFLAFTAFFSLGSALPLTAACTEPVTLDGSKNIWLNYTLHPHVYYRSQALAASELINNTDWKKKALKVADSGTFLWIESKEDIPKIDNAVKDVPCNNILGLAIAGLSHQGCDETVGPSPRKRSENSEYLSDIIASIAQRIKSNPNTAFALILEPGILPFVVRNPYIKVCETAQRAYRENVPPALQTLDLPNVVTYLDAAHGGFFGWNDRRTNYDIKDVARELTNTWVTAGGKALKQFRGLAVNIKSYNSWDMAPGETFSDENAVCADLFNKARNEQRYLDWLEDSFKKINSTIPFHNIMDVARSGQFGIRQYWHDWCNNKWAGFGPVPTLALTKQVHSWEKRFDSFVWATPAGFSDGTSDAASPNHRANCSSEVAFKPMPEKGVWSQSYFESLVQNARWAAFQASSIAHADSELAPKLVRRCDRRMA